MRCAPPSTEPHPCRGATLLDLLLTITILGIVTAVAVRTGNDDELELDAAARTIAADMLTAQALAIESRVPFGLRVDTTRNRGWFVLADGSTPAAAAAALRARTDLDSTGVERLLAAKARSEDGFGATAVATVDFAGAAQVVFGVDGAPRTGGLVQLQRQRQWLRVRVQDATGRIRVTAP